MADNGGVNLKREIGVFGGVAVNVGIIIGSGIFLSPKGVLAGSGSVGLALIIWFFSGIFSLVGALCFAELGTMIPLDGGVYAYVHYTYGPLWSFLFQWIGIVMVQPGAIAITSITFATYAVQPFYPDLDCPPPAIVIRMLALTCLILVSVVNVISVKVASKVQETFAIMKMVALGIIIVVGIVELGKGNTENLKDPFEGSDARGIGLALYAGLYAYAGWNSLNIILEELKDPYKNLPRCIVISVLSVTGLYVFVNVAYFTVLTTDEILMSNAVAATFGLRTLGKFAFIMPLSVAISTFGSVNGNILTVSRIFFAGARDRQLPRFLSFIHPTYRTPVPSIITIVLFTVVYTFVDDVFTIINYFSFITWSTMGFVIAGLLYLRWKEPDLPRPFKLIRLLSHKKGQHALFQLKATDTWNNTKRTIYSAGQHFTTDPVLVCMRLPRGVRRHCEPHRNSHRNSCHVYRCTSILPDSQAKDTSKMAD
ncbi:putative Y+L amino acid transporter 2 isoform X1 [Apostichopus japonicus]|uniref:Putative Y+L amino acid transporter 2 isoform X1 n=1 Tax=Stichopus japonicus TaxID=307972 RepID=A0A2G8KJZ4_STIJA|nr:putative Y+L amino acid transporter 2 isoform X1 [Apostichopus japonicus]